MEGLVAEDNDLDITLFENPARFIFLLSCFLFSTAKESHLLFL